MGPLVLQGLEISRIHTAVCDPSNVRGPGVILSSLLNECIGPSIMTCKPKPDTYGLQKEDGEWKQSKLKHGKGEQEKENGP